MAPDIREIQQVGLGILLDVDRVCRKHNIRYSLYCGTLLGCIRHKGFIPWDDDIDIVMDLKNYRRFAEVYPKEAGSDYELSVPFKKDEPVIWLKVYNKNTTYSHKKQILLDCSRGASIDIYPMIGEWKVLPRLQSLLILGARAFCVYDSYKLSGFKLEGSQRLLKICAVLPRGLRLKLSKLFIRLACKDPDRAENIGSIDAVKFSGKFKRSDWKEFIDGEFEGRTFPIPAEYNRILTICYGYYMQLPPENMRHKHYDEEDSHIIDMKKGYREYREEYRKMQEQKS